ncbi:MAG TPA: hypothetical protein VIW19_13860, partial [Gaiellaceae bacterium]
WGPFSGGLARGTEGVEGSEQPAIALGEASEGLAAHLESAPLPFPCLAAELELALSDELDEPLERSGRFRGERQLSCDRLAIAFEIVWAAVEPQPAQLTLVGPPRLD